MAFGRKRSGEPSETVLHEEFVLADRPGRKRDKLRIRATDQALHIRGTNLDWRLGYDAPPSRRTGSNLSLTMARSSMSASRSTTMDWARSSRAGLWGLTSSRLTERCRAAA